MTDLNKLYSPIFLSEKEIKKLIELLFFSYRDFTMEADLILEKFQFGRAHHRIIYFVGKKEKITIKELLLILKITKQSLSRVLNQLVKNKYVNLSTGSDKRTKNLSLTKKGLELEKKLSDIQIKRIKKIISNVDEKNMNSFKNILYSLCDEESKKKFNELNKTND
tara:strand:- start:886 stop:1380 length:495 start_codon:yes stop_codon:yes gene_type:complete